MTPAGLTGNQPYQQTRPVHTPSHEDVNKLQSQLLSELSPAAGDSQRKPGKRTQSRSITSSVRASAEEQSPGYKKVEGGYQCDQCDKRFPSPSKAKRHLRIHTGETPYLCQHCGKKFNVSSNLIKHLRIHSGETPYECEHCDKKFSDSSNLTTHLRIHTGATPYQCEHCSKTFKQSSDLTKHVRIHTGETPYECQRCGTKFNRSDNMIKHLRLHTGEKPFKCEHCEFASAHKSCLNYHMKTKHPSTRNRRVRRSTSKKTKTE